MTQMIKFILRLTQNNSPKPLGTVRAVVGLRLESWKFVGQMSRGALFPISVSDAAYVDDVTWI